MTKYSASGSWPVLKKYDGNHLGKIAMPLGGIGTGTISLGGKGDLRDWEICNAAGKGYIPYSAPPTSKRVAPFFAVRTRDADGTTEARLLEGPIELHDYEGQLGSAVPNHGYPRFRNAEFHAAYPFGQVLLSDPGLPFKARLKAFNPLVPGDADASGLPVAVLTYEFENLTGNPLELSVCGTIPNFIGEEKGSHPLPHEKGGFAGAKGNQNVWRQEEPLKGIFMDAPELPDDCRHNGNIALTTLSADGVTYRTGWLDAEWGGTKLDFWNDFIEDGELEERTSSADKPLGSVCVKTTLPASGKTAVTFIIAWHFPNRRGWSPNYCNPDEQDCRYGENLGNYYTTRFADAFAAAAHCAENLPALEEKTLRFVNSFVNSDLPEVVKEAALFNLSTLRTETCFRTADGRFFVWEGSCDCAGCCEGSCTHVWNYEQTTAFVFGELARDMRRTEFLHATDDRGHMSFRIWLTLETNAKGFKVAAADGQMGCIMKACREWQLSGDDAFLRELWPRVKKALEFCWIEGGWDADRDGVMEGCQHNTMDVEYYGPNPQMGFWYLGALRCAALMADHLGDAGFATECRRLAESGARILEEQCFNGEFYEQIIVPLADGTKVAEGLTHDAGAKDPGNPDYQLGGGCLVDQLVGQQFAHVLGMEPLSDPASHRKALESIYRYNFKRSFSDHYNHFRSYVLGDEAATLMATYPVKPPPENPFPYATEVMTGFEYVAAVHMLYAGMEKEGLELIRAIRDRYDGRKRSPFDEAECGHHYGRAMAAWAAGLAWTGFSFSGVDQSMRFAARSGTWFWSNGEAWGECRIESGHVELSVLHGTLELKQFRLDNGWSWSGELLLRAGETRRIELNMK